MLYYLLAFTNFKFEKIILIQNNKQTPVRLNQSIIWHQHNVFLAVIIYGTSSKRMRFCKSAIEIICLLAHSNMVPSLIKTRLLKLEILRLAGQYNALT